MCGFSGQITFQQPINRADLDKSIDSINYRGPDALGYWFDSKEKIGLAHRRLSIIDLSDLANQPMLDKSDSLVIVFNGEIYNFQKIRLQLLQLGYEFISNSDTEVILKSYQEWGVECLSKLEGMFSFLIVDLQSSIAFMARDIAGEKPFFYYYDEDSFIFSSELKGVLAFTQVNKILNHYSFEHLLKNGYAPTNKSLVKNVYKLAPAHAATIQLDKGDLTIWQYWKLPELRISNAITNQELQGELFGLMNHAVSKQLLTDVPLGVLLSGGLDSSIITALAANNSSSLKTYTVCFPSHPGYNAAEEARLVANYVGTEHTELTADQVSFEDVLSIVEKLDEPFFDSSIIPTFLVSSLISKYCKVALGGDGGDELFGGYGYYQNIIKADLRASKVPDFILKGIGDFAANFLAVGKPGRNFLQHLHPNSWIGSNSVAKYFDKQSLRMLLSNYQPNANEKIDEKYDYASNQDWIDLITRQDFNNYLPNDILTKVDRASMIHSLEMRAPFLDKSVIEFAYSRLQSTDKVSLLNKKIFLKKVFSPILPSNFNYDRKQGFSIPLAKWMNDPNWVRGFSEVLLGNEQSFFNKPFIAKMLNNQQRGYSNSERLFGLFIFEVWRKRHNIQNA